MKTRKGQAIVGGILAVIIAVIIVAIVWNFSQGASGTLRVQNEAVTATNNTARTFANCISSVVEAKCGNGTLMALNTDYYAIPSGGCNLIYNATNKCGALSATQAWAVSYDYYSSMYISESGLTRTVLSYIGVALIITILIIAFAVIKKGE